MRRFEIIGIGSRISEIGVKMEPMEEVKVKKSMVNGSKSRPSQQLS